MIFAVVLDMPVGIALITFLPLIPTLATLVFELVGLHDFGKQYGLQGSAARHYVKLVAWYAVLSRSCWRPRPFARSWREWRGNNSWELTRHVGAHLPGAHAGRLGLAMTATLAHPAPDHRRFRWRSALPGTDPGRHLAAFWPWSLSSCLFRRWNIIGYPGLAGNDDEGTYLSQAWAVRTGMGLAHYTYWYDHPPLGWIQIAGLSWLPELVAPDVPAVAAGRIVMLAFTGATVALLYVVARRLQFAPLTAGVGALLFGLSPLALSMQRQIYLDNIAMTWIVAAFALALSPRRHLWSHVGAGVCAGVAVLSKETTLLIVPALLYTLWQNSHPTTRGFSVVGFFWCGFGLVCGIYPLLAALKGELLPGPSHTSLFEGIKFQLFSRESSGSVFTDGSDAYTVLMSWIDLDPVFLAVGMVSVIGALAVRQLRGVALAGVLVAVVALRPGGYLPAMYVLQVLPFFALCTAGLAELAVRAVRRGRPVARPIGAVVVMSFMAATFVALPHWLHTGRQALTTNANGEFREVRQWLADNVADPGHTRVLVDDNLWLDLVDVGFVPGTGVIWFNKLDLDPEVAATVPGGWRDIDYLVSTPGLRHALTSGEKLPTVAEFVENSTPVATFGVGVDRIEVRAASGDDR